MTGSAITWLVPALLALFLYGIGQGLVRQWISEVSPVHYCFYFIIAKAMVNLGYFFTHEHAAPFAAESMQFTWVAISAYILDGLGWVLYFEAIVSGPISIIGTLSAAYPVLVVILAKVFLGEHLQPMQNVGVASTIIGAIGLSWAPADKTAKFENGRRWLYLSIAALVIWGVAQTLVRYSYSLPGADETNMALFNTFGAILSLGVYVFIKRKGEHGHTMKEFRHSVIPMAMMAGGDLAVIIAASTGPISVVAPITGSYPMVTLVYAALFLKEKNTKLQWFCLLLIVVGVPMAPGSGDSSSEEVPPPAVPAEVQSTQ